MSIRAGIIGGAGYTAGELIRLLLNHPEVELTFVNSTSNSGNRLTSVHEGLIGETSMTFTDQTPLADVEVLFLCSGHGASRRFWQENERPEGLKVIDLAQDYRDESDGYVYGLPEVNRDRIAATSLLANPGCFATAIQLSLLPLACAGKIAGDVSITGVTGSTGAGVKPGATTHFSWRTDNLSVYKPFAHQHLLEIRRTLGALQPDLPSLDFLPVRGDFARGIYVMAWLCSDIPADELRDLYAAAYADEPFTHLADGDVDLKQAVNTNKAIVGVNKIDDKILITTAIDNLLKGASGQAVQNMNIMFDLDESTGLRLKPSAF